MYSDVHIIIVHLTVPLNDEDYSGLVCLKASASEYACIHTCHMQTMEEESRNSSTPLVLDRNLVHAVSSLFLIDTLSVDHAQKQLV